MNDEPMNKEQMNKEQMNDEVKRHCEERSSLCYA